MTFAMGGVPHAGRWHLGTRVGGRRGSEELGTDLSVLLGRGSLRPRLRELSGAPAGGVALSPAPESDGTALPGRPGLRGLGWEDPEIRAGAHAPVRLAPAGGP